MTRDMPVVKEIDRHIDTYTDGEIADVLNECGVRTVVTTPWTAARVAGCARFIISPIGTHACSPTDFSPRKMWPLAMASCCRPFIFEAGVVCFALTPLTIEATTSMKFRRKTCLRSMLINVSSTSNP